MRKLKKNTRDYVTSGVILGAGSVAISSMGGGAPLSGLSGMMPAIGTATGGAATIRILKSTLPKKKRKKRRY